MGTPTSGYLSSMSRARASFESGPFGLSGTGPFRYPSTCLAHRLGADHALLPNPEESSARHVRAKFAELRFVAGQETPEIETRIEKATDESRQACERCGSLGRMVVVGRPGEPMWFEIACRSTSGKAPVSRGTTSTRRNRTISPRSRVLKNGSAFGDGRAKHRRVVPPTVPALSRRPPGRPHENRGARGRASRPSLAWSRPPPAPTARGRSHGHGE